MKIAVLVTVLSFFSTTYAQFRPSELNKCPKTEFSGIKVVDSSSQLGQWSDNRVGSLKTKFETLKRSDPEFLSRLVSTWNKKCGTSPIGARCFLYESDMYPNGKTDHVLLFRGSIANWTSLTSSILRIALDGQAPCEGTCNLDSIAAKTSSLISEVAPFSDVSSSKTGFVYDVKGRRWMRNNWTYLSDGCRSVGDGTYVLHRLTPEKEVDKPANPLWLLGVNHANGVSPFWRFGMLYKNEVVGFDPFVSFSESPEIAVIFSPHNVARSFLIISVPENEVPDMFDRESKDMILRSGKLFRPAGMNLGEREVDMTIAVDESALRDVVLLEARK